MHEEVSVLLLSVGESTGELKAELERLGVSVVESDFLDAEEKIAEASPDLVVLGGARGAMELATLLDDQEGEHRPRMVIVAARKDLARLRGLNREVVISLFALETTEKVVGQRVESLARRAARRRVQAGTPAAPNAKATSLGLPSAQAIVGQLNLKRVAAPSPPGIKIEEALQKPDAVETASLKFADERPEPPRRGIDRLELGPDRSPEAPPRPAPSKGSLQDDVLVLDEDLLSLPPSQPPEGNTELERMPATPGLPSIETLGEPDNRGPHAASDPPISIPPTLPPEAKEKSSPRAALAKPAKTSNDDEELDISDAEKALENLDSSKAAITASLLKDAQDFLAESKAASSAEKKTETLLGSREDALTSSAEEDDGVAGVEAAIDNLGWTDLAASSAETKPTADATEPQKATQPALESSIAAASVTAQEAPEAIDSSAAAASEDETETASAGVDIEATSTATPSSDPKESEDANLKVDPLEEVVQVPVIERKQEQTDLPRLVEAPLRSKTPDPVQGSLEPSIGPAPVLPASEKRRKGGLGLILAAVAALGLGGAYSLGLLGPSKRPAAQETAAAVRNAPVPTSEGPTADAAAHEPPQMDKPAEPAPLGEDAVGLDGQKTETGAEAQTKSSTNNPFLVVDAAEPACETLVAPGNAEAEKDPVYQASVVWQEAREMIVAGKLKDANIKMCEAVALNPESAAVEGLAALYLRLKSPQQALKWADRAEQLRPGQSEMGYVRGDIYSLMGRSQEARAVWLKTLNIPEEDVSRIEAVSRDYSVEAGRHLRRGDLVRADQWFRRAVTLDPKNVAGIIGLAKTFHRAGDTSHARVFCEMSLAVSDEIPEVHVMLGEFALADGDKAGARVRFERALAIRPDFFPAKRGLSQVK